MGSEAEAALVWIATHWLGREPTAEEGLIGQQNSGMTALEITQAVQRGPYASLLGGRSAEELLQGMDTADNIIHVQPAGTLLQGSASLNPVRVALSVEDAALQHMGGGLWEGTSLLTGEMLQLQHISRLQFSDAHVALDMDGHAGEASAMLALIGALGDQWLAGEALAALDAGATTSQLGAAAWRQVDGSGTLDAGQAVQWLWTHATGSAGSEAELRPDVQWLTSGQAGLGDLAWAAANHLRSHPSVELAGVQESGLAYQAL